MDELVYEKGFATKLSIVLAIHSLFLSLSCVTQNEKKKSVIFSIDMASNGVE